MLRAALIPGEVVDESGAVEAYFPLIHHSALHPHRQAVGRERGQVYNGAASLLW